MAKILIIDDEQAIRETLAHILADEGHQPTLCDSGEAAIAQFAREEYDLVFLDLWLPGIDGMAVLDIKAIPLTKVEQLKEALVAYSAALQAQKVKPPPTS